MQNIKIIKTGINVKKMLSQLEKNPQDWGAQKQANGAMSMLDRGFPEVQAGVLQLVMGAVKTADQYVGDSELSIPTDAYYRHTEIIAFLKRNFKTFARCGYLSLPIGGEVGKHIDIGSYYQTRDRYHLAIQGTYDYTVGDETIRVEPGTLLWFNNKLEHGTKNVGDCVRITFVFDVPHKKK
ncbi:Aspartyl/asparaginy/proline hydroxylase [uncultured Caudovirales phage]|uniref:Aspartyl/asparaginy/proline hydroxylase n=1 Tax=uncultured Caudovirales phage TaxID=2100421 RepID=A0A6J7WTN9_9CAUD|nr:Aspartyl/asparaginy/proline hydroxylase [uncultured Caudovirales phage]